MTFIEQFSAITSANPNASPIQELAQLIPEGVLTPKGKKPFLDAGEISAHWIKHMKDSPGKIRWNLMSQEVEVDGQPLTPTEQECIYIPIQQRCWSVNKQQAKDALALASQTDAYHPVRDFLESVRKEPIIDISRLASTYLRPSDLDQTEPTIYDRMLVKTLVGAVNRAYEAGCQYDTCLVLKGGQGIRKTSFWRTLFSPYFAIFRGKIGDKDSLLVVHSSWALELGELDHITSATHAGHLNNFITTDIDHFRPPYASKAGPVPRPSIFVGSCNEGALLYDDTGNRRWWIIPCEQTWPSQINTDQLVRDRKSIWSSALKLYEDGYLTYLDREDEKENNRLNDDFGADNPLEDEINRFLEKNKNLKYIKGSEILDDLLLHSLVAKSYTGRQVQTYVKQQMCRLGWSHIRGPKSIYGDSRPRVWSKPQS